MLEEVGFGEDVGRKHILRMWESKAGFHAGFEKLFWLLKRHYVYSIENRYIVSPEVKTNC